MPGQGNQSRSLIIASKMQGWDPTKIEGGESIENFDAPADINNRAGTGRLPGGTPNAWPNGYDVQIDTDPNAKNFQIGDPSRETENRASRDADPAVGLGRNMPM